MEERELRALDVIPVDKVASLQPANWRPAKQEPACQKLHIFYQIQGKQLFLTLPLGRTKETPLINDAKTTGLKPTGEKPGKV